ncbi:hypothetical protein ISF_08448 [Cordyceps fumosorosea ARSEF 2679]|uniref:Uncharacterized protein n=1 Tax=Cordyceps fumosorosea (strain ARSEF 2679) TaxID=1081104 RepID=A0A167MD36_CORFA|nr:hypothetical protein ISF_08448 [Cordyceps fumosorosea ARSEF 2679]OAA54221.1 hypothetical protein ISF_08448 [Cordyceps fumosorosea ARSEF 2679]
MPSNKDRLYVALFARAGKKLKMPGGEDKYHWALILAPKHDPSSSQAGLQIDVKNTLRLVGQPPLADTSWRLEVVDLAAHPTTRLLARVLFAKVRDRERLLTLLTGDVPVRAEREGWNCVAWVREAFEVVVGGGGGEDDGGVLGRRFEGGWEEVREVAMGYVRRKQAEGRFDASFDQVRVPTWDALRGVELVP